MVSELAGRKRAYAARHITCKGQTEPPYITGSGLQGAIGQVPPREFAAEAKPLAEELHKIQESLPGVDAIGESKNGGCQPGGVEGDGA